MFNHSARNLQPIHVEFEIRPWFGAEEHVPSIEGMVSALWGRLSRAEAKRSRRGRKRARRAGIWLFRRAELHKRP